MEIGSTGVKSTSSFSCRQAPAWAWAGRAELRVESPAPIARPAPSAPVSAPIRSAARLLRRTILVIACGCTISTLLHGPHDHAGGGRRGPSDTRRTECSADLDPPRDLAVALPARALRGDA